MAGMFGIAIIAAAASLGQPTVASGPLRLIVDQDGGTTVVRVVGVTKDPSSVSYALEVTERDGANRSVQRGTANLRPGLETVLATVRLKSAITNVAAKLTVTADKSSYQQVFDVSHRR